MATIISNLTQSQTRNQNDKFEIENSDGNSRYQNRLDATTIVESDLITLDSTNYTINTTPLEVQAAPGNANKVLVPIAIAWSLDYVSTVFDVGVNGIDLIFSTDNTTALATITQANVNAAADKTYFQFCTSNTIIKNDSLQLYAPDGDLTQGDGALYVRVLFSLQDFTV